MKASLATARDLAFVLLLAAIFIVMYSLGNGTKPHVMNEHGTTERVASVFSNASSIDACCANGVLCIPISLDSNGIPIIVAQIGIPKQEVKLCLDSGSTDMVIMAGDDIGKFNAGKSASSRRTSSGMSTIIYGTQKDTVVNIIDSVTFDGVCIRNMHELQSDDDERMFAKAVYPTMDFLVSLRRENSPYNTGSASDYNVLGIGPIRGKTGISNRLEVMRQRDREKVSPFDVESLYSVLFFGTSSYFVLGTMPTPYRNKIALKRKRTTQPYFTVELNGMACNGHQLSCPPFAILDTGSNMVFVPERLRTQLTQACKSNPAASIHIDLGSYLLRINSTNRIPIPNKAFHKMLEHTDCIIIGCFALSGIGLEFNTKTHEVWVIDLH